MVWIANLKAKGGRPDKIMLKLQQGQSIMSQVL